MHLHSTCHGSYTDLSSLGVYLSRVMANTHTHTNTYTNSRPARSPATTYGNGQARLTFLPRSILPTRPFPVVLSFSLSFYLSIFFSICSSARPPVHLSICLFFSLPLFLCLDIVQCSYCGRESRPITTRTIREPSTPCVLHLLSFSNPCFSSLLLPRPLFSPAFLTARVFTGPSPLTPSSRRDLFRNSSRSESSRSIIDNSAASEVSADIYRYIPRDNESSIPRL